MSLRSWGAYPFTYRAQEVQTLAGWILAGASGSVVGLAGAGKSNLLGFVCQRPEALQSYLPPQATPVSPVMVDLNNLPSDNLAALYRVILRSFYEVRDRFDPTLGQTTANLYRENRAARDPFLPQSALRELLLEFRVRNARVVLVLDHFDRLCQTATSYMLDNLRGLRDSFKDILLYVVSTRQEMVYLFDPTELGEMYEIVDIHVCWVGPMIEADALCLVDQELCRATDHPTKAEAARLLTLAGCYPALLKAACHWWLTTADKPDASRWARALLAEQSIQSRLGEIWSGLTQEERKVLFEHFTLARKGPPKGGGGRGGTPQQRRATLDHLKDKGLCRRTDRGWRIFSNLFAAYVAEAGEWGGGKIWLDNETGELHQGQIPLENLTPLEREVLGFLVKRPRVHHTKTDLIVNAWPDALRQGVTDDSLYQVIRGLRAKIEPNPTRPCYVTTWRGRPEGGYRFFPEGRPG